MPPSVTKSCLIAAPIALGSDTPVGGDHKNFHKLWPKIQINRATFHCEVPLLHHLLFRVDREFPGVIFQQCFWQLQPFQHYEWEFRNFWQVFEFPNYHLDNI